MRVLYISTYFQGGGAEKVARQLYYGIQGKDIETFFLAGRWQKNLPSEIKVIYNDFLSRSVTTIVGGVLSNTLLFTRRARKEIINVVKDNKIDIIHFHNLHSNYLGITDLVEIRKYCPNIIITLHDMWMLTGCCAHALDCKEWEESGCRNCKGNATLKNGRFYSDNLLEIKKDSFSRANFKFVTPSSWLKQCCLKSYLKNEDIFLINNGINLDEYRVLDKKKLRIKYNISVNKRVLLFVANGLSNPYKGFMYLQKALELLNNKGKYALVVLGNKGEHIDLNPAYEVHDMGYITEPVKKNELFSVADLFVMPSIAEVLPLTPLETMASGTPVVAFDSCGIPECVSEDVGWLVSRGDSGELAQRIDSIFEHKEELVQKTDVCRTFVEKYFSEEMMIKKYRELYINLLKSIRE